MEPLYFQGRILKLGLKVTVIQTLGKTKKVWIFFSAKRQAWKEELCPGATQAPRPGTGQVRMY